MTSTKTPRWRFAVTPRNATRVLNRRARRAHALDQVRAARSALVSAVADVLAARSVRCSPGCPGWYVCESRDLLQEIRRCDPCAALGEYVDDVSDLDVSELPEARKALGKAIRVASGGSRGRYHVPPVVP